MEISQIKQQLSILEVLEHYGLSVDKNNRMRCPFHNDKTPSMQIYPKTNTYTCFSSNCHAGSGDAIQFIELMEKKRNPLFTKHQAIMKAKELLGHVSTHSPNHTPSTAQAFTKLQQNLGRSSKAQDYLKARYLQGSNLEMGYNAAAYPQLKNCLVFPLKDAKGEVVSLYGRGLQTGHYYLKNRSGLYPKYPDAHTKTLILTESVIDCATLLNDELGITNDEMVQVLALYGTNGLTPEHEKAIAQLTDLQEIVLWFDGDEAGRKAVEKVAEQLEKYCPKLTTVAMPEGEDINSLLDGHEPEILLELFNHRKGISTPEQQLKTKNSTLKTENSTLKTSNPNHLTYTKGSLKSSILGGIQLNQFDRLRVTILLEKVPKLNPLHSIRQSGIDLYNDGMVEKFIRSAANKLEVGSSEIRLLMAELTDQLEAYRQAEYDKKQHKVPEKRKPTEARKQAALDYLKAPDLMQRTNVDIGKSGMIGEEVNRLLMYIVFTSRLRESPLHVMSLGASGTGKTFLQECIVELMPEEDVIHATSLSENALYYFGTRLAHKLIVIEDLDGASEILYQLRELMSKKSLSKLVVLKNKQGQLVSEEVHTQGPICVTGTTTQEKLYEDNANRSLLLYLDNSKAQQDRIMAHQRAASAGQTNPREEAQIKELFKDIQSLLKPVKVVNPYAQKLNIPQQVFKPLRSNSHYLQFIECVTFYHQYQREIKQNAQGESYIETTLEDIEWANRLLKDVLLAKADELSGACRKFFERLKVHLKEEGKGETDPRSFYGKEIREAFRMSPTTLKRYLFDLQRYGYVKVVGGNKHRQGYEYEVANYGEYQKLENNIKNALDEALERLKKSSKKQERVAQ